MSDAPASRPAPSATSLLFTEAIDFLRAKLGRTLPSTTWTDTYGRVNSVGFAVAGAWKDALLADLGAAVLDHLENGKTVASFQVAFEAIAARHQWAYKGKPAWRAAIILNTNLRSAYAAGKWQQIQRLKAARPWLRYVAVQDQRTRPQHQAWHGTILHADDPWWTTHYPPNGWNCRCTIMQLSERDLARNKWTVTAEAPPVALVPTVVDPRRGVGLKAVPAGIDPGFEHNPAAVLETPFVPQLADDLEQGFVAPIARDLVVRDLAARRLPAAPPPVLPPLPEVRTVEPSRLLPADTPDGEAVAAFLAEFGLGPDETGLIDDHAGGRLGIGPRLFQTARGVSKVDKQGRKPFLLILADLLKAPDEVWVTLEQNRAGGIVVKRRAIGRFEIAGQPGAGVAAFEWDGKNWSSRTIFPPRIGATSAEIDAYLTESARLGVLIYRRG